MAPTFHLHGCADECGVFVACHQAPCCKTEPWLCAACERSRNEWADLQEAKIHEN